MQPKTGRKRLVCPEVVAKARKARALMMAAWRLDLYLLEHDWKVFSKDRTWQERIKKVRYTRSDVYEEVRRLLHRITNLLFAHSCGQTLCPVHGDPRDTNIAEPECPLCGSPSPDGYPHFWCAAAEQAAADAASAVLGATPS